MSPFEFNKIIAALLTAGVVALACGFVAGLLLPAAEPLEVAAYELEVEEADGEAESEHSGSGLGNMNSGQGVGKGTKVKIGQILGGQKVAVRDVNYRNQGFDRSSGAFGLFLLSRQDEGRNQAVCEAVFRLVGAASESGVAVEQQRITYWLDRRE